MSNGKQQTDVLSLMEDLPCGFDLLSAAGQENVIVIVTTGRRGLLNLIQNKCENFPVYLWNNGAILNPLIYELVGKSGGGVVDAPFNMGPFPRYVLARALTLKGAKRVVFLDDDWDFPVGTITLLFSKCVGRSMIGHWAFRFRSDRYSNRVRVADGEHAHYVGPGGCCVNSDLLRVDELFACPEPYRFAADDVYLSWVAFRHGFDLRGMATQLFRPLEDDTSRPPMWPRAMPLKHSLLSRLVKLEPQWII